MMLEEQLQNTRQDCCVNHIVHVCLQISLTEESSSSDESMAIGAVGGAEEEEDGDAECVDEEWEQDWEDEKDEQEAVSKGWEARNSVEDVDS